VRHGVRLSADTGGDLDLSTPEGAYGGGMGKLRTRRESTVKRQYFTLGWAGRGSHPGRGCRLSARASRRGAREFRGLAAPHQATDISSAPLLTQKDDLLKIYAEDTD
jgi:hypothetical protein